MDKLCSPVETQLIEYSMSLGFEDLTEKERQILKLVAGGFSNKEIASSIFLAEGTVKNHVSNILAKLNTRDRTRAVLIALNQGLV